MPLPIQRDSINTDMQARVQVYTTVDASPSGASETVIATLTISRFSDMPILSGVRLSGWAAFTCGSSASAITMKIRQTNVSGATKGTTGALTAGIAGGALVAQDVECFDSGAGASSYALTLTVTGTAAASTVSALILQAIII